MIRKVVYKAAVLHSPKNIRIEDVPLPKVGKQEVLVEIRAANLCPTDVRKYIGLVKLPYPLILGHEAAGIVTQVGEAVSIVKEGDRVALMSMISCGRCKYCRINRPELCDNLAGIGACVGSIEKYLELFRDKGIGGAFAEYIKVPEEVVVKLPTNISLEEGSLIEPLAIVLRGQEVSELGLSDTEAVLGAGPIGALCILTAKALGAGKIIVSEPIEERRKKALELGADEVIDPTKEDPVEGVLRLTDGKGADAIIVAAGGRAQASCTEQAVRMATKAGRINVFAGTYPPSNINVDPNLIHYRELIITGTFECHPRHFYEAIELILTKSINITSIRYPVFLLEKIVDAFEIYGKPDAMKVGIKP